MFTDASHRVPPVDSDANGFMRDAVGNKNDGHTGTSLMSLADTLCEHAHMQARVIPTGDDGITVTSAGGAWTLGAFAVVAPTNAITSDFDLHFVVVEDMSANVTYELVLYSGADASEVEIGRVRFTRAQAPISSIVLPIQTPITAANSQIKAKIMDGGGGNNAVISLFYHIY